MDPRDRKPTFDIMQVDFEWVEKTTNIRDLQQALRALKEEGGYDALEKAVEDKLVQLNPSLARPSNQISEDEKRQLEEEMINWEKSIENQNQEILKSNPAAINVKKAEEEKEIGNDYMKSKDYKQAIQAYDKAQTYNPNNAAIYCNRALARLNLKHYELCIDDCNKALVLDNEYLKAYLRRGKARMALKQYRDAIPDFEYVLSKSDNNDANKDLKKCRDEVRKHGGFKKIEIVEEDEEEEEAPIRKEPKVYEIEDEEDIKTQQPKPNEKTTNEIPAKEEKKETSIVEITENKTEPKIYEITEEQTPKTEKPKEENKAPRKLDVEAATNLAAKALDKADIPKTAYAFEHAANALKNRPGEFHSLLMGTDVQTLFEKTQFSYELLMQVVQTLLSVSELDSNWGFDFFRSLENTSRFNTTRMFLTKSDKEQLAGVINRFQISEDQKTTLKQIYKI